MKTKVEFVRALLDNGADMSLSTKLGKSCEYLVIQIDFVRATHPQQASHSAELRALLRVYQDKNVNAPS
jgi:hypothetical protein